MDTLKQESSNENSVKKSTKIIKKIPESSKNLSKSLPATLSQPLKDYQEIATESGAKIPPNSFAVTPAEFIVESAITAEAPDDPFHCHNEEITALQNSHKTHRAIRVLWLTVFVCLGFMVCEVIGGWWAQSLAIITDAAHLLTDLASMLISLFSLYLASRPASQRMSFGWHRAEVVGAFISVFMIWVVTGILVYLAIERIITKNYDINAPIMAITAGVGVLVNILMGFLLYFGGHSHSHGAGIKKDEYNNEPSLNARRRRNDRTSAEVNDRTPLLSNAASVQTLEEEINPFDLESENKKASSKDSRDNINIRAAFIHVLGDLIQSVGVLLAALLILWNSSWGIVDPICTLMFSIIVVSTTVYIIRDALVVLLEGRPSSIDFRVVFDSLEHIEGVKKVHDLRIWALTMNKIAISVHLEIDPHAQAQNILKKTTLMLRKDFNVHESTVQIEGWQEQSENCFQCIVPPR